MCGLLANAVKQLFGRTSRSPQNKEIVKKFVLMQNVIHIGTAGFGLKCLAAPLQFLFLNYLRPKKSVVCNNDYYKMV